VAHDPDGINVALAYLRTVVLALDKGLWGGPTCSPLPAREKRHAAS
jgi:hypothetical protein